MSFTGRYQTNADDFCAHRQDTGITEYQLALLSKIEEYRASFKENHPMQVDVKSVADEIFAEVEKIVRTTPAYSFSRRADPFEPRRPLAFRDGFPHQERW